MGIVVKSWSCDTIESVSFEWLSTASSREVIRSTLVANARLMVLRDGATRRRPAPVSFVRARRDGIRRTLAHHCLSNNHLVRGRNGLWRLRLEAVRILTMLNFHGSSISAVGQSEARSRTAKAWRFRPALLQRILRLQHHRVRAHIPTWLIDRTLSCGLIPRLLILIAIAGHA
jgi:hypothetical protein